MSTTARALTESEIRPVVVDLGKKKAKAIKALKRGEGKLMDDVAQVVEEVRANLSKELAGKELIPVVIIYQKKQNRRKAGGLIPFVS